MIPAKPAVVLLPCPFCNKTETVKVISSFDLMDEQEQDHGHPECWHVNCDGSREGKRVSGGCGGTGGAGLSVEAAIENWNKRAAAPSSAPVAEVVWRYRWIFEDGSKGHWHYQEDEPDAVLGKEIQDIPLYAHPAAPEQDEKLSHSTSEATGSRLIGPHGGLKDDMPSPTGTDLVDPLFNAIWDVTKRWDVNAPEYYVGYCGMNGSHVMLILNALRAALASAPVEGEREFAEELYGSHFADGITGNVQKCRYCQIEIPLLGWHTAPHEPDCIVLKARAALSRPQESAGYHMIDTGQGAAGMGKILVKDLPSKDTPAGLVSELTVMAQQLRADTSPNSLQFIAALLSRAAAALSEPVLGEERIREIASKCAAEINYWQGSPNIELTKLIEQAITAALRERGKS